MSELGLLNEDMEGVLSAVRDMGLEKTSVVLSEGFCPLCVKRSSDVPVIDPEDEIDDRRPGHSGEVNCHSCNTRWRTGMNGENGQPWVEISRPLKKMGATLSMALNPPPDPTEEDDGYWDEFDNEDD